MNTINSVNNEHPSFDSLKSLFVIFEISQFGRVKAIFPVVQNEREEKILEEALDQWRSAKKNRQSLAFSHKGKQAIDG